MAVKKGTEKAEEQEILKEAAEEPEKAVSAWDEETEMIVPRKPKGEEQQYYICVNDRRFAIPANGKMQKLPKPVAQILQDSLEAEVEADEFADHMPNRSAEQLQGAI